MAYQTGSASSPTDLLQTLVTWLVGRGWTSHASGADGSGWRAHLSKGGVYANFRAAENESVWTQNVFGTGYALGLYLGDGYSGAAAWNAQAGGPLILGLTSTVCGVGVHLGSGGPFPAYHFFDDGDDNILVMVEHAGGVFGFLGFGLELSKDGHDESMPYFFGSQQGYYMAVPSGNFGTISQSGGHPMGYADGNINSLSYVRLPSSIYSVANRWASQYGAQGTTNQGQRNTRGITSIGMRAALYSPGIASPPSSSLSAVYDWTGSPSFFRYHYYDNLASTPVHSFVSRSYARTFLAPPWVFIIHPTTGDLVLLGRPPSVFGCMAVGYGWAAGEVLVVGGLDYMVFPNLAVRRVA